jgi:hypothetical protein
MLVVSPVTLSQEEEIMSEAKNRFRWQDTLNLLLGIGVGISPWLLGYDETLPAATWNAMIVGGAIVVLAAIDIDAPARWEEWGIVALGVWLAVSPFVLGLLALRTAAMVTIGAGLAIVVLGLWALLGAGALHRPDDHAHGH